ncbi:OmpA/MotB family protein [Paraburkholderia acidipaludis]|uniref:OmpA/MotB family protein n=1 Tax=Paraburkholderia acidipaludis TaxID=660537 RepID=UPI0004852F7B|nr:OmpA family protein [Paraburkholderia acidipaludis]
MPTESHLPFMAQDAQEEEGHDAQSSRWLISYADLITTMMVLFLALYVMELAKNKEMEIRYQSLAAASQPAAVAAPPAAGQTLLSSLEPLRERGEITIMRAAHGVEIGINAKILFDAGDARLLPVAFGVLDKVADVLREVPSGNVLVEGHTDSTPISNAKYASNWELSSARAGAVVRYLVERGVAPRRLAAIGRADNFPLVAADDPASRAQNRRVTIFVEY